MMRVRYIAIFLCTVSTVAGCGKPKVQLQSVHGQTVEHWISELKRRDPKARIAALSALQSVGAVDPLAVPAITGALDDKVAKVRDAAVIALLNTGPPAKDVVAALEKAKSDSDAMVRSHAEAALERIAPND
ncbi:MAG TPA: HEAT repeat domain-containing protein [Lacipirellulaceae bacterium]|nr:HEAT repeat domain-containing protein [Lacipirellulaceae bacterium]